MLGWKLFEAVLKGYVTIDRMTPQMIDLQFHGIPNAIASYLLESQDGLIMIESGPSSARANHLDALSALGIAPSDIKHLLVTHIHFDHAGGAGWWAEQGTRVYVHPVGAPHLIDPAKLWKSAKRVYGDDMEWLWGEIRPIPAEQVHELAADSELTIGGVTIRAIDTPGHAWHHYAYLIEDNLFSGDVLGVQFGKYVFAPTPPPEFKLPVWQASIDKVMQLGASDYYLTHGGKLIEPETHVDAMRKLLDGWTVYVRERLEAGRTRAEIVAEFVEMSRLRAVDAGFSAEMWRQCEIAFPHDMSVDGIMRFWRKKWEKEGKITS